MQKAKLRLLSIICVAILACATTEARAIENRDVQVAARTFGFVDNMPSGTIEVAIIYDPAVDLSIVEADKLVQILGDGLLAGRHTLTPKKISISDIDTVRSKVAFITMGMGAHHQHIFDAVKTKGVFTFTKDFSCISSKFCVLAVETQPSVRIEISNDAATASGLAFGQALKMMVKMKD